jgi:hypothetical protein
MSPVSTMVCDNCGDEAVETLVTRARWRAYERDGGVGYLCGSSAPDVADRQGEPAMLVPAVARERHGDDDADEASDEKGMAGRIVEWVVGR